MTNRQSSQTATDITVEGLSVVYGSHRAVEDLAFTARDGEIYGILGPSGAGKSSVLGALTGVVRSSGRIMAGRTNITNLAPRHRRFGNVYQDFRLFDWMSVFDNVAFGCRAQGWNRARIDCRVHDVLEGIGLGNAIARPVIELSGGERQRVAIARAFACEPHGLLLDEPFSDLDPPLRRRLRADLLRWLADNPTPAILVTHDRWEAFELCDRIGFLSEGRLHQEGAPEELYDHPATPTVAEFMGCDNCLAGSVESSDPPFVCVRTPAGVLSAREMRSPAVPGTPVQLRCRPQSAGLLSHESPAENRLRVTCATIHQVEDHRVATLVLENGALWTARWPGEIEVEPGGEITIVIPPTELLAYPDAPW